MRIITLAEKSKEIHECIGYQNYYTEKSYRKSPYVYKKEIDNGIILYNTMTREISLITGIAEGESYFCEKLVRGWYFIPHDINPKTIVYCFWQKYLSIHPKRKGKLSLATIFTTTECNARCPYCYEYGTKKETMSEETAEAAAKYILERAGNKILLKWFGGEPLLNHKAIDIISKRVRDSGIEYRSYIVSNAYLFDKISDEKIKNLWKISQAQITVDGTEKEYQKIKGLPSGAYMKALDSIVRLAMLDINVSVRIHITNSNVEDIKNLIVELSEYFSGTQEKGKNINVYAAPLFEGLGMEKNQMSDTERLNLYDSYINIDKMISRFGMGGGAYREKIKSSHCMADNCHSIVIAPNGDLTPCEHCHDKEIIGTVWSDGEIPEKWFERAAEIDECEECICYPICYKLKMCEAEPACNEAERSYKRYQIEKLIDSEYKKYMGRRSMGAKGNRNSEKGNRL
jgi:radical SAM protein with 4Fe4S-binding SPASM domain